MTSMLTEDMGYDIKEALEIDDRPVVPFVKEDKNNFFRFADNTFGGDTFEEIEDAYKNNTWALNFLRKSV